MLSLYKVNTLNLYKISIWDVEFSQTTVGLLMVEHAEKPEDTNFSIALSDMWD